MRASPCVSRPLRLWHALTCDVQIAHRFRTRPTAICSRILARWAPSTFRMLTLWLNMHRYRAPRLRGCCPWGDRARGACARVRLDMAVKRALINTRVVRRCAGRITRSIANRSAMRWTLGCLWNSSTRQKTPSATSRGFSFYTTCSHAGGSARNRRLICIAQCWLALCSAASTACM